MSSDQTHIKDNDTYAPSDAEFFKFSEATIIREYQASGWRHEGDRLSKSDLASLVSTFSHEILWPESKLRMMLSYVFKLTFAEFTAQRTFEDFGTHPARAKALKDSLEEFEVLLLQLEGSLFSTLKDQIQDIFSDWFQDPDKKVNLIFLDYVADHFPEEDFPKSRKMRINPSPEDFIRYCKLLKHGIYIAEKNKIPGGNGKPYHEVMVRRLAAIYQAATGEVPVRHYSRGSAAETGPLNKLSHEMARIIEKNMPDDLRRAKCEFPGICRKVSDEMRKAARTQSS